MFLITEKEEEVLRAKYIARRNSDVLKSVQKEIAKQMQKQKEKCLARWLNTKTR